MQRQTAVERAECMSGQELSEPRCGTSNLAETPRMTQRSPPPSWKDQGMQNNSRAVGGNVPSSGLGVVPDPSDGAIAGTAGGAGARPATRAAGAARTPSPLLNPSVLTGPPPLRRSAPPAQWRAAQGAAPLPAWVPVLQADPRAEGERPVLARKRAAPGAAPTFGLASAPALTASRDAAAGADTDADADAEVAHFNAHLPDPPRP